LISGPPQITIQAIILALKSFSTLLSDLAMNPLAHLVTAIGLFALGIFILLAIWRKTRERKTTPIERDTAFIHQQKLDNESRVLHWFWGNPNKNATVGHLITQVHLSREEIAEALEALAVKQKVVVKDGEYWSLAARERLRFGA
jgi:membrane protein implicated in regulation of membrane protease activity